MPARSPLRARYVSRIPTTSAASSDSRHMMSSVSITAASLHHQRAAPLLVEVVEELVASGREPRDVDRDRPTGRHHALAVQLEALELDRRRGLVRDLEAEALARRGLDLGGREAVLGNRQRDRPLLRPHRGGEREEERGEQEAGWAHGRRLVENAFQFHMGARPLSRPRAGDQRASVLAALRARPEVTRDLRPARAQAVRGARVRVRERSPPGLTAAEGTSAPASPASDAVHAVLGTGRAPTALAALGADAVELHPVAPHHEAEEATDAVLEALQLLARELDDLAATLADDVVVVLALALDRLEARLTVVEVALGSEPDLLEQLERAVDGGVADAWVHLLDRRVELLDGEVPRGAEEHARDVVPLGGRFETPLAQRLLEPPHPRAHRHGGGVQPAARARRSRSRRAA